MSSDLSFPAFQCSKSNDFLSLICRHTVYVGILVTTSYCDGAKLSETFSRSPLALLTGWTADVSLTDRCFYPINRDLVSSVGPLCRPAVDVVELFGESQPLTETGEAQTCRRLSSHQRSVYASARPDLVRNHLGNSQRGVGGGWTFDVVVARQQFKLAALESWKPVCTCAASWQHVCPGNNLGLWITAVNYWLPAHFTQEAE